MQKKDLLIIFSVALLIRALFLFHPYETGDSKEYRTLASNLIKYSSFTYSSQLPISPTTHRTPVFPGFIALIYLVFGMNDKFIYAAQAVISAISCLVVYFIALDLFSRKVAFWSAMAVALHPFMSWFVNTSMPETLFAFLLLVAIFSLSRAVKLNNNWLFLLGGILLGISALCRPTTKFMFLWVIFILLLIYRNKKVFLKYSMIFLVGFFLSVLPWCIRHYIVSKQVIFITSQGPDNLYLASLPGNVFDDVTQYDFSVGGSRDPLIMKAMLSEANDSELRQVKKDMWKKIIANISANPLAYIGNRIKCEFFLWVGSNYIISMNFSEALSRRLYGVLILKSFVVIFLHILPICMYFFAGWLLRKGWRKYLLVYSVPVYFAILHFPIHIEMRYSMPAYPYILIFCIYAIQKAIENKRVTT